jgi:hypothetical protein
LGSTWETDPEITLVKNVEPYIGSRSCPYIDDAVRPSIEITYQSARKLAHLDLKQDLPRNFVKLFNRAILYLLWHQAYAIAARGVRSPYVQLSRVCQSSGLATLTDKDSGSGHKTRLVWMPPELVKHMQQTENCVRQLRISHRLEWDADRMPLFFLTKNLKPRVISPKSIEELSHEFFPFPANTSRRVMRFMLLEAKMPSEYVEMYLGHWGDRREPWGKWSSFDCSAYLSDLRLRLPMILAKDLCLKCPSSKRKRKAVHAE